jgi:hypothetical protein
MMKLISYVVYGMAMLPVLLNLEHFKSFPWDASLPFSKNIGPYFMIALSVFALYQLRKVMGPMVEKETGFPDYTEFTRGFIRDIGYSDTRVGNSPLFKAKVFYSGNEIEFDLLPESFQFNFSIGDEVVIRHHPEDVKKATLDVDLSIEKFK